MGFALQISGAFSADVDGTPVSGSVKTLSAADRLNYSSSASAVQDGENVEAVVRLVDQWVAKVMIECDATIDDKTYSQLDPSTQALYVAHLPMAAKEAAIRVALGLGALGEEQAGNSEAGPKSD
jgi:hypothetical protein